MPTPVSDSALRFLKLSARLSLAAALLVMVASCRKDSAVRSAPEQPVSVVLARAGNEILTESAFLAEVIRRGIGSDEARRRALLEEMTGHLRLLAYAREHGLENDPEVRRSHETMLIAKAREALHGAGAVPAHPPSEEELQAAYNARRDKFASPASVRVAMILTTKRPAMDDVVEAAKELPAVEKGFGAIAAARSEDQATRYVGGDFGELVAGHSDGALPPEALAAAFALKTPGELSPVVASPDGFRIFRLISKTESVVPPYAKVRPRLLSELTAARRRDAETATANRIAALPGESFPEHLARIPSQPESARP